MQNQLHKIPAQDLRVYTVWIPMLGGDSRDDWDGRSMPDPRVLHFWDGEYVVGQWFAKEVDGYEGIAWDVYYLYGPEATWETIPAPLVGSGETIYSARHQLETQLTRLIEK